MEPDDPATNPHESQSSRCSGGPFVDQVWCSALSKRTLRPTKALDEPRLSFKSGVENLVGGQKTYGSGSLKLPMGGETAQDRKSKVEGRPLSAETHSSALAASVRACRRPELRDLSVAAGPKHRLEQAVSVNIWGADELKWAFRASPNGNVGSFDEGDGGIEFDGLKGAKVGGWRDPAKSESAPCFAPPALERDNVEVDVQ